MNPLSYSFYVENFNLTYKFSIIEEKMSQFVWSTRLIILPIGFGEIFKLTKKNNVFWLLFKCKSAVESCLA